MGGGKFSPALDLCLTTRNLDRDCDLLRLQVLNHWVPGILVISVVQVLGKYMIIEYLNPLDSVVLWDPSMNFGSEKKVDSALAGFVERATNPKLCAKD